MNKEAIIRKEMIIGKFRSKLTYLFNSEDLEDVENIIDFYEQKVNQLEEENQRLKDIYTNTIRHLRKIGRDELASWMECQLHPCLGWTPMVSTTNEQKEYGSRDIRTGKLSRINTKE